MRRVFNIFLVLLFSMVLITGCSGSSTSSKDYKDLDVSAKYKLTDASVIELNGSRAKVPKNVSCDNKIVTIEEGGSYVLTGNSKGLMIYIDADDEVDIYLDNISMEAAGKPVIYSRSKADVHLIAIDATENSFIDSDKDYDLKYKDLDSLIYSGSSLILEGNGKFNINSSKRMGVKILLKARILDTNMKMDTKGNAICSNGKFSIKGGVYDIKSGNDCISTLDGENGVLELTDGSFTLSAENDALHSESDLICHNPTIKVTDSNEAMEGVKIVIKSGVYDLTARDDGINASTSDSNKEVNADGIPYGEISKDATNIDYDTWKPEDGQYHEHPQTECDITVEDGEIRVVAGDDGFDSNASIHIYGGKIFVYGGPTFGAGSIDYETTATVDGGLLVAYGAKGMVTPFNDGSCNSALLLLPEPITDKSSIEVVNSHENIVKLNTEKDYDCVLLAGGQFVEDHYTIKAGENSYEFDLPNGHNVIKLK